MTDGKVYRQCDKCKGSFKIYKHDNDPYNKFICEDCQKKGLTFEEWKTQNEKQLIQDYIEDYEDAFTEYCKIKYEESKE